MEGFDIETGDRKWELSFDESMASNQPYSPTNDSLVVVGTQSSLTAITENGDIEWTEDLNLAGDPLGMNNTIFVPTFRGIEARGFDGSQKWTWNSEAPISGLGYSDGAVYAKTGTSLYSISSGETDWEYRTTVEPSTPPVARDGLVYIGTEDNRLVAISVDESTIEWEQNVGSPISAPLTIGEHVYAAGWSYPLKAYNPMDGTVEWSFDPTYQTISAALEENGSVYVGSSNDLFARNMNDGRPEWEYSTDSAVWAPPAIDNNRVYITAENGAIICLTV